MVNLTINGQKISVSEGTTILEAALKVGIDIPHLCYLKDINEIGACRVRSKKAWSFIPTVRKPDRRDGST